MSDTDTGLLAVMRELGGTVVANREHRITHGSASHDEVRAARVAAAARARGMDDAENLSVVVGDDKTLDVRGELARQQARERLAKAQQERAERDAAQMMRLDAGIEGALSKLRVFQELSRAQRQIDKAAAAYVGYIESHAHSR